MGIPGTLWALHTTTCQSQVEQHANNATPVLIHGPTGSFASDRWPMGRELPMGDRLVIEDAFVEWITHRNPEGIYSTELTIQTAEWLLNTTSRRIVDLKNVLKDRSGEAPAPKTVTGKVKRQLDLSIRALANPLKPNTNGVVVAPHGILGQAAFLPSALSVSP